jgi:hypothetical protein
VLGDEVRRLRHGLSQRRPNREVAALSRIVAVFLAPAKGEHLHAGKGDIGVAEVLALALGDLGNGAQDEGGGEREFNRKAHDAYQTSDAPDVAAKALRIRRPRRAGALGRVVKASFRADRKVARLA